MNSCIYINSIIPEKFLNKYKLTSRANWEIVKPSQKGASTCSRLYSFFRKIEFEESYINLYLQQ